MLSDDLAPWGWLLVRDNQSTIGSLVNVILVGVGLGNHGETNKNGNQSRIDALHKEISPFITRDLSLSPVTRTTMALAARVSLVQVSCGCGGSPYGFLPEK